MSFRIQGLSPKPFAALFGLSDADLAARNVVRYVADTSPGFPDRVEMRDVTPGETVLLINHVSQPAETPYRASHAIFVREGATRAYDEIGVVPEVLRIRPLSLRAFDARGMMVDADLVEGERMEPVVARLFGEPSVDYIHAHYARRGCYACRISRAV